MKTLILKSTAHYRHYGSPRTDTDADYVVFDSGKVAGRIVLGPPPLLVTLMHHCRTANCASCAPSLADPQLTQVERDPLPSQCWPVCT
jgi:hypothetical protein